jgi:iron(II)-dependent oxidoreductase
MHLESALADLVHARRRTDQLFELIKGEALQERPVPQRHRLIFYLGHLEAFDWNQMIRGGLGQPSFDADFDKLFAFGIDPEPGRLPSDRASDWPKLEQVRRYNSEVRRRIDALLDSVPAQLLHVAIEHRLMHAETLAYLLHNLHYRYKQTPPEYTLDRSNTAPDCQWILIPAGQAQLGQPDPDAFGWDNEFSAHTVEVPQFLITRHKVTNCDYLEFVKEGARPPHYWRPCNGSWNYAGMFEELNLPMDWPVYVTHEEASAYAEWAGAHLPTEPQFHRAAYGSNGRTPVRRYPWGGQAPQPRHGNFNFQAWDPSPVTAHPDGASAFGLHQLLGNGWEWTSTVFAPFDGFQPFPAYPGYSADFFDGKHFVLKGASPRTAAPLLRSSFRNWFRADYPYLYASFRLVKPA